MNSIDLSPLELDPRSSVRRAMPRPPHLRQPDYEEKFDALTVFYDCFKSVDETYWVFIGPPLSNLKGIVVPLLEDLIPPIASSDERSSSLLRLDDRKNSTQLWFRTDAAEIEFPGGLFLQSRVNAQPNQSDLFLGKRVLMTQSKNNELAWIHDWAQFFARNHGCDAVLFYDNGSTKYDALAVHELISRVPGIDVVVVVHWPFKYGPPGSERNLGPQGMPWDSNYLQMGMLEHARNRFLSSADAVVNADVDELVLTSDKSSVFDLAKRSATGYLRYRGWWIENVTTSARKVRRHADFSHRSRVSSDSFLWKWAVVPSRCEPQARWFPHRIGGMEPDTASCLVSYRHFRAISTGWKYSRSMIERPNKREHFRDEELAAWMRVFDRAERSATTKLMRAWRRWRRGRSTGGAMAKFLGFARRAVRMSCQKC